MISPRRSPAGTFLALGLLAVALLATPACSPGATAARRDLERLGVTCTGAGLFLRTEAGDETTVEKLLLAGVSPDSRDSWQRTPLHRAAWMGNASLVGLLLSHGADVNASDAQGRTPLDLAAAKGQQPLAQFLIEHGASVPRADHYGLTPLHRAAWTGSDAVVALLLQHGASVDAHDQEGQTPLHLAAWTGSNDLIRRLLDHGADPNARGRDDETPLHVALVRGKADLVGLLLKHGAKPDVRDGSRSTPLHRAAWAGDEVVARLLLDAGADVHARDDEGRTPLHRLWMPDALAVPKLLLDRGADVNARDRDGETPLDCVLANGAVELARVLRARGAKRGSPVRGGGIHATSPAAGIPAPTPAAGIPAPTPAAHAADLARFRERIRAVLSRGILPIVDVEFHYGAVTPIEEVLEKAERNGVALLWVGPNPRLGSEISERLHDAFPESMVPMTCCGSELPWIRGDASFLEDQASRLATGRYFGMGEFECRHYATVCNDRDVYTRVDSPQMEAMFALSERHGVPLLLHHEAEDGLIPEVERMLERHPRARLIWCHGGRNRNASTWRRMSDPGFVGGLLERHPNLYFDLVQLPSRSRGEEGAPLYACASNGAVTLDTAWRGAIMAHPDRFLVGSDANGHRIAGYDRMITVTRTSILAALPDPVAARVAFKNAWKLMSGEDWRD